MMRGTSGSATDKTPSISQAAECGPNVQQELQKKELLPQQFRSALQFIPASRELQ